MAMPPSWAPEKSFRDPWNRPTGVRAPATITDLFVAAMGVLP
ncbi:hypothetical protein L833_0008 [Mycobacteroides abscessus MAB_091912_2446]|uniref:Uncharacterized protein n=1 Tax=Mycobacteroides abscessus MAB_091912_2446 TaxID=1335414 RepID=A0A829M949_9MYCO|nr:hypothetical protein L833_0008 [Mycobacteroides abscessus MAB_091912_2446]